jgi:hypothetical protein
MAEEAKSCMAAPSPKISEIIWQEADIYPSRFWQ